MKQLFSLSLLCYFILLISITCYASDNSTSVEERVDSSLQTFSSFARRIFGTNSQELSRTISSSMRALFKSPVNSLVYAASLAIGMIVMLAFYESPISPLPVPPLPKPPVGRFPPEFPVWPPPAKEGVVASASAHRPTYLLPPTHLISPPDVLRRAQSHSHPGTGSGRPVNYVHFKAYNEKPVVMKSLHRPMTYKQQTNTVNSGQPRHSTISRLDANLVKASTNTTEPVTKPFGMPDTERDTR